MCCRLGIEPARPRPDALADEINALATWADDLRQRQNAARLPWKDAKEGTGLLARWTLLSVSAAAHVTGLIRGFTGLARSGVNRGRFRTSFVQLPLSGGL